MARRMEALDEDELALEDKLDLARTMLSFNSRRGLRREKDRVTSQIKASHREEVKRGEVTTVSLPTADEILGLYASSAPALNPSSEDDKPVGRKKANKKHS